MKEVLAFLFDTAQITFQTLMSMLQMEAVSTILVLGIISNLLGRIGRKKRR